MLLIVCIVYFIKVCLACFINVESTVKICPHSLLIWLTSDNQVYYYCTVFLNIALKQLSRQLLLVEHVKQHVFTFTKLI